MGCPKIFSGTAIFSSFTTDLWVTARNYSYNKKTVTRLDLYKYSICVWLILTGIDWLADEPADPSGHAQQRAGDKPYQVETELKVVLAPQLWIHIETMSCKSLSISPLFLERFGQQSFCLSVKLRSVENFRPQLLSLCWFCVWYLLELCHLQSFYKIPTSPVSNCIVQGITVLGLCLVLELVHVQRLHRILPNIILQVIGNIEKGNMQRYRFTEITVLFEICLRYRYAT